MKWFRDTWCISFKFLVIHYKSNTFYACMLHNLWTQCWLPTQSIDSLRLNLLWIDWLCIYCVPTSWEKGKLWPYIHGHTSIIHYRSWKLKYKDPMHVTGFNWHSLLAFLVLGLILTSHSNYHKATQRQKYHWMYIVLESNTH